MMNNPIFNALANNTPLGNMQNFLNQFNQFKRTFNGDPQQTINEMLKNGQINQSQLDQAKQMAEQIQSMMK